MSQESKRARRREGYANALAEMHYLLRNRLPADYTRDTTAPLPTQVTDLCGAIGSMVAFAKNAGWEDAIITAAENLRVAPRHLDRTGRAPMSMSDLIVAVAETTEEARQTALNTVADELLPADEREALGPHFSADTLALALGNHATATAQANGAAGYQRGYHQAQADAANGTIRAVGGGVTITADNLSDTGRSLAKARHDGALEAARSMARQLYGQAGRTVRSPRDLIELVRARTEFEVREATGEQVTEGTAVHTPLRDERIRRDTLRASLSWVSQNWNLTLDDDPNDRITTPEDLGARLTSAMDQKVAQEVQDTIAPARLGGAKWVYQHVTGREYDVTSPPGTGNGNKILAVADALREHVGQLEADAETRGLTVAARHIQREVCGPWRNDLKREEQQTYTEIVTDITDRVRWLELHVLQELHNRVFGPDGTGEQQDTLPAGMTVASYADGLSNTIKDNKWQAESMAMDALLRDLNIPRPEIVDNLYREDAAAEIRRHIAAEADRRARAASANVRCDTMQEISDELSRTGFWRDADDHRLPWRPVITGMETPTQFAVRIHNQCTFMLTRRSRARLAALLRGLGRGDLVGQVTTVTGVLKVLSEMLDEQTAITAYRIIRESLGLDAAKPLLTQMQDDNDAATYRERVIDTACGAVNAAAAQIRAERERVLWHIWQQVFGEVYNPAGMLNEDVLIANLKVAVHRPKTVLGWSLANTRYVEIRRQYTVDHDRENHTADDFRSSVLAILHGPDGAVVSRHRGDDGHGTWTGRDSDGLWKLGGSNALRRARRRGLVEAAALLMCAVEAWPQ